MAPEAALFLDLDGVLLDVSARYYKVHADICAELGTDPGTFEGFWEGKRRRASVEELSGLPRAAALEYRKRWTLLIESPDYLPLDVWLPQARTALLLLNRAYTVVVVTLRRRKDALRAQLKELSFPKVAQVLSAAPKTRPWDTKAGLIRSSPHFTGNDVVVGDTEVDIRAGRELGATTVGVLSGLRAKPLLAEESPDLMIESVAELPRMARGLFEGGRP